MFPKKSDKKSLVVDNAVLTRILSIRLGALLFHMGLNLCVPPLKCDPKYVCARSILEIQEAVLPVYIFVKNCSCSKR